MRPTLKWFTVVTLSLAAGAVAGAKTAAPKSSIALSPPGEVKWTPMSAEAGDKGPQLAVVFGDPGKGPFGALLKFPAGFRPGPHTHSSDYWGVVISGAMADFPPGREDNPIASGGYYFQPHGVAHDNHCAEGAECVVFMYMPHALDSKPVKVAPAD